MKIIFEILTALGAFGSLVTAFVALKTYKHNKQEERFREQCKYLYNALNKRALFRPYYKKGYLPFVGTVRNGIPIGLEGLVKEKKQNVLFKMDKRLSLFDNFYYYFQCHILVLEDGKELSCSQIIEIYNRFFENLVQRDVIDAAFNEIYNTIDEILTSCKNENARFKKIRIIQSQFPSKQLILYFINQVQYADRQRFENTYANNLKKYNFFKRMIESNEYRMIEKLIPESVEKLVYSFI